MANAYTIPMQNTNHWFRREGAGYFGTSGGHRAPAEFIAFLEKLSGLALDTKGYRD